MSSMIYRGLLKISVRKDLNLGWMRTQTDESWGQALARSQQGIEGF